LFRHSLSFRFKPLGNVSIVNADTDFRNSGLTSQRFDDSTRQGACPAARAVRLGAVPVRNNKKSQGHGERE
jgi:hypothetical protein